MRADETGCWCWCCELARVETGLLVLGAGFRWRAVKTGCWCWCPVPALVCVRGEDRLLVLLPGAGAGAVSWLCAWWRQVAGEPLLVLRAGFARDGDRLLVPGAGAGAGHGAVSWLRAW